MVSFQVHCDVDVHNITVPEWTSARHGINYNWVKICGKLPVRNTMNNHIVHARTTRLRKSGVMQRRRVGAVRNYEVVYLGINLVGSDTWLQ